MHPNQYTNTFISISKSLIWKKYSPTLNPSQQPPKKSFEMKVAATFGNKNKKN